MPFIAYRLSPFGPPVICKTEDAGILRSNTKHSVDDPLYPMRQIMQITDEDFKLSLTELRKKYPYVSHIVGHHIGHIGKAK